MMNTRRTFLKTAAVAAAAGGLMNWETIARAAEAKPLLVRDARDTEELNFATLWAACHPGKRLESYTEGKDPLTGAAVWGSKRTTRQTETGWKITALGAMDLACRNPWRRTDEFPALRLRLHQQGRRDAGPIHRLHRRRLPPHAGLDP
jgi:hypothetical protein